MSNTITAVTLTSGHTRESAPAEVPEHVINAMAPLLNHLADSGDSARTIPLSAAGVSLPGYSLAGRADGTCLTATVWADGPPSLCVCTIAVALSGDGADLWRDLHQRVELPVVTDPGRPPAGPWVAAALYAGCFQHPDCLEWLGDFERCLAWAWQRRIARSVLAPEEC